MTRYLLIDSSERTLRVEEHEDFATALAAVGLKQGEIDFGTFAPATDQRPGLGYVVYQYGLFRQPAQTSYVAVAGRLIAGNVVCFAFNQKGENVSGGVAPADWPHVGIHGFEFLTGPEAVAAIDAGRWPRPEVSVNDEVIWRWPNPPPEGYSDAAFAAWTGGAL